MRVGLIDADMMWQKHANGRRYGKTKADIFPNLVCMKLSAWHKSQGDSAEWYNAFDGWYDKPHAAPVYKSLQRWVNMRAIFHKVPTFEEYSKIKAKE